MECDGLFSLMMMTVKAWAFCCCSLLLGLTVDFFLNFRVCLEVAWNGFSESRTWGGIGVLDVFLVYYVEIIFEGENYPMVLFDVVELILNRFRL